MQMHWEGEIRVYLRNNKEFVKETVQGNLGYYNTKMDRGHLGAGRYAEKFTICPGAVGSLGEF